MSIKAFELVPAIERLQLMGEKAKTAIECIECCGKNLYIGSSDCFVMHFLLEEKTQHNGKVTVTSKKQSHKYLAVRKPIVQLKAASALTRILVLCDNTLALLHMFNLEPIMSGAKIKGVTSFCVNENPTTSNPFSIQVCVATKKKALHLYTVTEDKMIAHKEISTSDIPVTMDIDSHFICVAESTQYVMINFESNEPTDLFPYDAEQTNPMVKRISQGEFLLSGPSALGMFVTSEGVSQRPPLQWSSNVMATGFTFPYVCALDDEFITVHSILDQQQKQTISFQGGKIMNNFEGKVYVASTKEVYMLIPVPVDKQIQELLNDKRVEEALTLAKNAKKAGMSREKFQKIFYRIQQQAGFIELSQYHFKEAAELFKAGRLDVRELINLFPLLLPANSNFTRSVPLLHEFADINQIVRHNKERLAECKEFLISYLKDIRGTRFAVGYKEEVDTALLKLYAEINAPELVELISSDNGCVFENCIETLNKYGRYFALGLLYKYHGDFEKALQIWTEIVDGKREDTSFPGLEFVVDFLASLSDHELVWRYVDWAIKKDELLGIKIFTDRPKNEVPSERLRPDDIIDYLHRYPRAVIRYLEYLVFTKRLEKEKYHTHLAVLYLDSVLQLRKNEDTSKEQLDLARSKLRHMLQTSVLYRVQLILGKVKETDMYAECAILYGKLEEHDKALRILVYKLKDYGAAENYCDVNSSSKDKTYRRRLYQILLSVYLDPLEGPKDALIGPAITLLNSNSSEFDISRVLQILPENWSIGLLQHFLSKAVRTNMHTCRSTKIERMLARGENLQLKAQTIRETRIPVTMSDDRKCAVCSRPFNEPSFARFPNGVITHTQCARNKYVCPISGNVFSTKKS
ncbi:transforming growth factor-beta receptor-associated protein 1-like isoform X2 [Ptychodera flava]|uniref:transforming growth factor-beta receptor-associated protein 1-like isoform X2 n=1 Tax=Ptychodera flava TaxID=63121 RepID=UPI00396A40B6